MDTVTLKTRFDLNDPIARENRARLTAAGVVAISLVGPAGSGKTALTEALLSRLNPRIRTAAIVAELAAERQVQRIARHRCKVIPLVTDSLAAINVRQALTQLNLSELDLLLIESEGSSYSPVEFDLGQHFRASVFSVAGGDDKATEYPFLVAGSDLVILNKIDLLPLVKFDLNVFIQDVLRIKPKMPVIQSSVASDKGIDLWAEWVESHVSPNHSHNRSPRMFDPFIHIPKR
jgi:hydrogenase nickel incorporation protein HypB